MNFFFLLVSFNIHKNGLLFKKNLATVLLAKGRWTLVQCGGDVPYYPHMSEWVLHILIFSINLAKPKIFEPSALFLTRSWSDIQSIALCVGTLRMAALLFLLNFPEIENSEGSPNPFIICFFHPFYVLFTLFLQTVAFFYFWCVLLSEIFKSG